MNERIRELYTTAMKEDCLYITVMKEDCGEKYDTQEEFIERFAELIVRECAGIYSKIDNGNLHMGTDDYLEALHKTFRS